jgi:hypothetical protein
MSTADRYRQAGMRPPRDTEEFPSESWTVERLRTYADDNRIDLGEATLKADILAAVTAAPIDQSDPFLEA